MLTIEDSCGLLQSLFDGFRPSTGNHRQYALVIGTAFPLQRTKQGLHTVGTISFST